LPRARIPALEYRVAGLDAGFAHDVDARPGAQMKMRLWACLAAGLVAGFGPEPGTAAQAASRPAPDSPAQEIRALADYDTSGDPKAALTRIDAALARARKSGKVAPLDMLLAEATRGEALFWLGRYEEALAAFRKFDADMAARSEPMTPRRADIVNNIGSALSSLGRLEEARTYKLRALDLSETIAGKDSSEYAAALYGLALIDYRRGLPLEAIPRIRQAVGIARAAATRTGRNFESPVVYGITLSTLQIQAGDSTSAVEAARAAATWADAYLGQDHRLTLAALNALGAALNDAGLYAQATPILRRALDLRMTRSNPDERDLGYSLNAVAYALDLAGFSEEALAFYERSAKIFEALPPSAQPMSGANVFGQIARIVRDDGQTDRALALYRKALAMARRIASSPDDPEVLRAELSLAKMLISTGDIDAAQALLDHVNAAYARRALPTNLDRVAGLALRAAIDARRSDPAAALASLKPTMKGLRDHLLDRTTAATGTIRLRDQAAATFVLEARIAISAGDGETAFDALQMAGMGDLQTAFTSVDAIHDRYGPEADEAIRTYLSAAAELRELRKRQDREVGLDHSETASESGTTQAIAAAEQQLRALDDRIGKLVPGYASLTSFEPSTLAAAQARLGRGQALVLYGQDADGLVVMAVTRDKVVASETPIASRRFSDLQRKLRASIENGVLTDGTAAFDRRTAWRLYQLLFPAPIAQALRGSRDLAILTSGMLASLPFGTLVTAPPEGDDADPQALRDTAWLVRRHAVSTLVSAASLAEGGRHRSRPHGFAGIGAPILSAPALAENLSGTLPAVDPAQLPPLPGAERELQAMARNVPGERHLYMGAQATEAAVKAAPLSRAGVIAFATHGLVGGAYRNLVEPALVLTPPTDTTDGEDGLLTASEVAQLKLDADWVILSACDTSAGESENAPTYSGLARAFVSAGARALLLSHWPVRDDVASRLTLRTVEAAHGRTSRAEALRRAQVEVLRDTKVPGSAHPATWAPFVLVGN
jgi:CHAT domain-containing protein/Tfp pilus assembly protein PilF